MREIQLEYGSVFTRRLPDSDDVVACLVLETKEDSFEAIRLQRDSKGGYKVIGGGGTMFPEEVVEVTREVLSQDQIDEAYRRDLITRHSEGEANQAVEKLREIGQIKAINSVKVYRTEPSTNIQ